MTYEITYYFFNNIDEKPKETVIIVQKENHSYVYHFSYDEIYRLVDSDDRLATYDQAHSCNANIRFNNLVDAAKKKYKYSAMTTSQTYELVENF